MFTREICCFPSDSCSLHINQRICFNLRRPECFEQQKRLLQCIYRNPFLRTCFAWCLRSFRVVFAFVSLRTNMIFPRKGLAGGV